MQPRIERGAADAHNVCVGRWRAMLGVFASVGMAYIVMQWSGVL